MAVWMVIIIILGILILGPLLLLSLGVFSDIAELLRKLGGKKK